MSLKEARTQAIHLLGMDASQKPKTGVSDALEAFFDHTQRHNRPRTVLKIGFLCNRRSGISFVPKIRRLMKIICRLEALAALQPSA